MHAIIENDLVVGAVSGPGSEGPEIPAGLRHLPLEKLHFDGVNVRALSDFPDIVAQGLAVELPGLIKAECKRRIFAEASQSAQMNMAAEQGRFDADQTTAYHAGLDWIITMRVKCAALITGGDATFGDDAHWPAVPADAKALADQF